MRANGIRAPPSSETPLHTARALFCKLLAHPHAMPSPPGQDRAQLHACLNVYLLDPEPPVVRAQHRHDLSESHVFPAPHRARLAHGHTTQLPRAAR